jgi:hypothetical protein
MSIQMRTYLQGPDLATADKERGSGALKMSQPSFVSDIPSAGTVPPQVCAPLCNAPHQQGRHQILLLQSPDEHEAQQSCSFSAALTIASFALVVRQLAV